MNVCRHMHIFTNLFLGKQCFAEATNISGKQLLSTNSLSINFQTIIPEMNRASGSCPAWLFMFNHKLKISHCQKCTGKTFHLFQFWNFILIGLFSIFQKFSVLMSLSSPYFISGSLLLRLAGIVNSISTDIGQNPTDCIS